MWGRRCTAVLFALPHHKKRVYLCHVFEDVMCDLNSRVCFSYVTFGAVMRVVLIWSGAFTGDYRDLICLTAFSRILSDLSVATVLSVGALR